MGFGGPAGGFSSGPTSMQANAEAGLPYAELPGDFLERINKVLEKEPEHESPNIPFSHREWDRSPFTLRSFLSNHTSSLFFAFMFVVIETGLQYLGPFLTKVAIDDGISKNNTKILVATCVVYVLSIALTAGSSSIRTSFTGRLGERLVYQLRIRVFSHLQRQPVSFFTNEKNGVLMTRMTSDIESLTVLFQEGLISFAVQLISLIVITIYLLILNPTLAIIALLLVIPINLLITIWFKKVSQIGYLNVRERIAEVLSDLSESLSGIRIIAAFNQRQSRILRHKKIVAAHRDANLYTGRAQALFGPGTEAIGILTQTAILFFGGKMVLKGDLSIGELTAFLLFLTSFFAPIQSLVQLYNQYQQGSASVTKLRDLLGTLPTVEESENAIKTPPIKGHIEFKSVTFGYEKTKPVLENININIEPGEVLAVVGSTGAGKSTVAKLVNRFYDPDKGEITIDGYNIRNLEIKSLREQIAVVPQEPFLFNGTIKENIIFGSPYANQNLLLEACEAVGLMELINRLPDGVESQIHERGALLSAGERQLLALARAFLSQPSVLVLDEATSNLDLMSEAHIESALDNLLNNRTALIVAHRLATAMRADRIIVIENGSITESGSHEELLEIGGEYASMYEMWMETSGAESKKL